MGDRGGAPAGDVQCGLFANADAGPVWTVGVESGLPARAAGDAIDQRDARIVGGFDGTADRRAGPRRPASDPVRDDRHVPVLGAGRDLVPAGGQQWGVRFARQADPLVMGDDRPAKYVDLRAGPRVRSGNRRRSFSSTRLASSGWRSGASGRWPCNYPLGQGENPSFAGGAFPAGPYTAMETERRLP